MLDRVRFAAACEASEMDEIDIFGSSDIEQLIKHEERIPRFVGMKRVHIGHHAIKAIFHIGNEILGSIDVCGVRVNVLEGENGAIRTSEAKDSVF